MKRFYKDAVVAETDLGWIVQLDGRPIKTQGGNPQTLPTAKLAELLAAEWAEQGETLNPSSFRGRDMADYAIDMIAPEPEQTVEKLLRYGETDTLCYRAGPDEPLWKRQCEVWDPILEAVERREGVKLDRVSGIVHRPPREDTLERLAARIRSYDAFMLAALETATALTASLCIGLESIRPDADADALWRAASLEEDWQADLWGRDREAEERRAERKAAFLSAAEFARLSQPVHRP